MAWKRIEELSWKVQSYYRDLPLRLWFAKTRREGMSEEGHSIVGEKLSEINPII
jgi:hypothetical protein